MFDISAGESKPKKEMLGANGIMWFEDTNFSHNFISWKDRHGLRWVAEARGGGVQIISNYEFKLRAEVISIYRYECDELKQKKAVKYIHEHAHIKYNRLQLLGLAEMRLKNKLYRKLGIEKRIGNRFSNGEYSQICVEFMLNTIMAATDIKSEGNVENYGLIEGREFNMNHGKKVDQKTIDRINGRAS